MSSAEDSTDDAQGKNKQDKGPLQIPKNLSDVQRIKINKMMSNPDKPVNVPSASKERNLLPPPEFNRHVMGSTAGAGSGDFHTYRHIRRRNQTREKILDRKTKEEEGKEEFQKRLRLNYLETESKTAKNRAKRQKQKERKKNLKEKVTPQNEEILESTQNEEILESTHTPESPIQAECLAADITNSNLKREDND